MRCLQSASSLGRNGADRRNTTSVNGPRETFRPLNRIAELLMNTIRSTIRNTICMAVHRWASSRHNDNRSIGRVVVRMNVINTQPSLLSKSIPLLPSPLLRCKHGHHGKIMGGNVPMHASLRQHSLIDPDLGITRERGGKSLQNLDAVIVSPVVQDSPYVVEFGACVLGTWVSFVAGSQLAGYIA